MTTGTYGTNGMFTISWDSADKTLPKGIEARTVVGRWREEQIMEVRDLLLSEADGWYEDVEVRDPSGRLLWTRDVCGQGSR